MKRSNAAWRRIEGLLLPLFQPWTRARLEIPFPSSGRFLVTKSCCLGDAVLSLYGIRAFKRAHPEARIEMLVTRRIRSVYAHCPDIDAVHDLPLTGKRLWREASSPAAWLQALRLGILLRRSRFDALIDLEVYRRHGPLLRLLLRIPVSAGFHSEGRPPPQHHRIVFRGRRDPEWSVFYPLFGLTAPDSPEPLYPRARPDADKPKIGIVFTASFNWPEKQWEPAKFAGIIRRLQNRGYRCVLYGGAGESGQAEALQRRLPEPVESTVGTLDFPSLITSLGQCRLVLGNDTGTLHVAAAAGVPTLAIFGPTEPLKWKPVGGAAVYLDDLACRPCYYLGEMPACSHRSCLRSLPEEKVWEALEKCLEPAHGPRLFGD